MSSRRKIPLRLFSILSGPVVLSSAVLTISFSAGALTGCQKQADKSSEGSDYYETRVDQETGREMRSYMGRSIADLPLSEDSSIWLDRPGRNTEELPRRLIRAMELRPAMVVADVGAGTGFFAFRLAKEVPSGRILAVDVQPAMLDTIRVRMQREGVRNIQPILGGEYDPGLPVNGVDVVLIVASYHEFSNPREMIEHISAALKMGGHLVIVEYRAEDETIPVPRIHRMSLAQIKTEIESTGLVFMESKDILPQQHFVVFEKRVGTDMSP